MKSIPQERPAHTGTVTLRVRVWIEIINKCLAAGKDVVTLRVRMWIEIYSTLYRRANMAVTLRVRVWIEILIYNVDTVTVQTSPSV